MTRPPCPVPGPHAAADGRTQGAPRERRDPPPLELCALRVHLEAVDPLPPMAAIEAGAFLRGVLVSALHYAACACVRPPRGGRAASAGLVHEANCPLADLLGETRAGARRLALADAAVDGAALTGRVLLYGRASVRADLVADAVATLMGHGIGPSRAPLRHARVDRLPLGGIAATAAGAIAGHTCYDSAEGDQVHPGPGDLIPAPWAVDRWAELHTALAPECVVGAAMAPSPASDTILLECRSPVDLGWRVGAVAGRAAAAALSLDGLARSVVRRWLALDETRVAPVTDADVAAAAGAWLAVLGAVPTVGDALRWAQQERFSARTRRRMPLAGVVGYLRATPASPAAAAAVARLLAAATLVPPGARTAFGFGTLRAVASTPARPAPGRSEAA